MYTSFVKKSFIFFIIIILLAACEGKSCVEADDFGEYNTDIITVDSQGASCSWADNNDYGTGDEKIRDCLTRSRTEIKINGYSCKVKFSDAQISSGSSCLSIKECINDSSSTCVQNFSIVSEADSEKACVENGDDKDNEQQKSLLLNAYNSCIESCTNECSADIVTYEPNWTKNNSISDGGYIGIDISSSNYIQVQALGNVVLQGGNQNDITFSVNDKKLQYIDTKGDQINFSKGLSFGLAGKWCRNGSLSNCSNKVGEFALNDANPEDPTKRYDFLRRGILFIESFPENGHLNSEGTYEGPLMRPDFSSWSCKFRDDSVVNAGKYECSTSYANINNASGYIDQNELLYAMQNNFVKTIGGYVIPANVTKYITTYPFNDVTCMTLGNVRKCSPEHLEEYDLKDDKDSISSASVQNGYYLTPGENIMKVVYPARIAFRIIKNKDTNSGISGQCTVKVSVRSTRDDSEVSYRDLIVKADNNWHFLLNDKGERALLNKDAYNTLQIEKEGSDLQSFDDKNSYNIVIAFNDSEYWTDEEGRTISCGQGMAAFLMPQNEILIDTSGFASFKNLLSQAAGNCLADDTNNYKSCLNNANIIFSIINPLYDFKENSDILENNFYEYGEDALRQVALKIGSSFDWSSDIFVRKGQILRFNEDNWFNFKKQTDDNSYIITNKVIKSHSNFTTNISDGLVLKIEKRPALICKGTAYETVDNPYCNIAINDAGEKTCSLSYSDYCSDESDTEKYCRYGCYGDYYVDSSLEDYACPINDETKDSYPGISKDSCTKCKNYLNSPENSINPEIEISMTQCYDLENYLGRVSNLTVDSGNFKYQKDADQSGGIKNYGELTTRDYILGARKLQSVFYSGSYGTLEDLQIDTKYKNNDGNYKQFAYISNDSLPFTSPKNLRFLVIDNSDLEFKTGYKNNTGNYTFSFTPLETVSNGGQLAVFIADKDWKTSDGFEPNDKFKTWIVKYNMEQKDNTDYGKPRKGESSHYFDSNGLLIDNATGANKIDMASLNIAGISEEKFKDLRLFFKIIDKEEKNTCKDSSMSQPSKLKVATKTPLCRCKSSSESNLKSCTTISCPDDEKSFENCLKGCEKSKDTDCVSSCDANFIIETDEEGTTCEDLYYNNSGSYTVQLRSPKDIINSTGYIVKYVMEPILEILDGKTIGLAVDHIGKPILCNNDDVLYKYGGDLPKWRANTVCSTTDPLVAKYCKEATENSGALNKEYNNLVVIKGANYLLPKVDYSRYGEICDPNNLQDPSKPAEEYPNYCFQVNSGRCSYYIAPTDEYKVDSRYGKDCKPDDNKNGEVCYQNCSTLTTDLYDSKCVFYNDGTGFLQRFYISVITDNAYQAILKICFTLMIMFYGFYYLLGMADLTHGELIKRVIKISFIYLMVGTDGWEYYNMFFVKFFKSGVDYLVFAVAGSFDNSPSINSAFVEHNFYDKSVLFSGVDKNLALIFSDQVSFKIWGLFFVSFFGWLYVFLIYSSILTYIFSVANALLLYLTAQFFISMLLVFGPIFFVLLVFDKTKEMFSKWINNLVSFSLEQIFLLTCLSLFNTLVYNIIKFVLSYRVCWRPVWIMNIPILGSIELMSFWKATTASSPSAAASAIPGLFQVLIIYLIADLMKSFIEFATKLGSSFGGGGLSSGDLSGSIKQSAQKFYNQKIKQPVKQKAKQVGAMVAKKTIGYKTKAEEKQEKQSNKVLRNGLKTANRDADKAVDTYKKEHGKELLEMSTEERNAKLADVRKEAFQSSVNDNAALKAEMKKRGISMEKLENSKGSDFTSSHSLFSLAKNKAGYSHRDYNSSEKKNQRIRENKKPVNAPGSKRVGDFSDKQINKALDKDKKKQLKELKGEKKDMSKEEYKQAKKDIKDDKEERDDFIAYEHIRKDAIKENKEHFESKKGKKEIEDKKKETKKNYKNNNKKPSILHPHKRSAWNRGLASAQNSAVSDLIKENQDNIIKKKQEDYLKKKPHKEKDNTSEEGNDITPDSNKKGDKESNSSSKKNESSTLKSGEKPNKEEPSTPNKEVSNSNSDNSGSDQKTPTTTSNGRGDNNSKPPLSSTSKPLNDKENPPKKPKVKPEGLENEKDTKGDNKEESPSSEDRKDVIPPNNEEDKSTNKVDPEKVAQSPRDLEEKKVDADPNVDSDTALEGVNSNKEDKPRENSEPQNNPEDNGSGSGGNDHTPEGNKDINEDSDI